MALADISDIILVDCIGRETLFIDTGYVTTSNDDERLFTNGEHCGRAFSEDQLSRMLFLLSAIEPEHLCHPSNRARVTIDRVRPSGSEAAVLRETPSLTRFFVSHAIVLHLLSTPQRPQGPSLA